MLIPRPSSFRNEDGRGIDQYPSGRRERLMCELANRLRQEFE